MFRKIAVIAVIAAILLTSCSSAETATGPVPVAHPNAPVQNMSVTPVPGSTSAITPELEIVPIPHPSPAIGKVEMYAMLVNAYGQFMKLHKDEVVTEEDAKRLWDEFLTKKLQIGETQLVIGTDILANFTDQDWTQIQQAGMSINDPDNWDDAGGAMVAAMILRGGCRTTCKEIFETLWFAMAHFASGTYWFTIIDGYMSSHAQPYMCGRSVSVEYLLDILEQNCEQYGYRVSYQGAEIRVTSKWHKKNSGMEYSFRVPEVNSDVVIFTTLTVIVVGVVIIAASGGSAAPVLVPVLLVL